MTSLPLILLLMLYSHYPKVMTALDNVTVSHEAPGVQPSEYESFTASHPLMKVPIHREVELGDAWLYLTKSFDLQARGDICECFDPARTNRVYSISRE